MISSANDYGIREGFAIAFEKRVLPARTDLEKRGARWKPCRTVANWCLWRALSLRRRIGPTEGGLTKRGNHGVLRTLRSLKGPL